MYDDISKIELVFGRVGYSVPIRIYADGKKCITIVPSYKGYDLLLHKSKKNAKKKYKKYNKHRKGKKRGCGCF